MSTVFCNYVKLFFTTLILWWRSLRWLRWLRAEECRIRMAIGRSDGQRDFGIIFSSPLPPPYYPSFLVYTICSILLPPPTPLWTSLSSDSSIHSHFFR